MYSYEGLVNLQIYTRVEGTFIYIYVSVGETCQQLHMIVVGETCIQLYTWVGGRNLNTS